jgi:CxxC-x17-CxxC domain-containing protein
MRRGRAGLVVIFPLAPADRTAKPISQESALSFSDKTLTCRDCGQGFTFTAGEQEFFASRGFANEPSRCPECRAARKSARGGDSYSSGGYSSGGYSSGGYSGGGRTREMFSVTCSSCGNEARVPFEPRGDKPVYCSDCFSKQRGGGGGGGGYSRSYR